MNVGISEMNSQRAFKTTGLFSLSNLGASAFHVEDTSIIPDLQRADIPKT